MSYVIAKCVNTTDHAGPPVLGLGGQKARTGLAEGKALAHELLLAPAQLYLPQ